ncbi:MAG TPA: BMP family ABC transporter substrate-binding protein [Gaiellaceae bacterium]|nr:BMP family ABC transporter substrate-binding protein [Gaiellaceae bacterium]
MAPRKTMAALIVALVALIALAVTTAGSAKSTQNIRVAVVTDIGGLNDKGFNALANKGLLQAKVQLGVEGRVFISKQASDYIPNLSTAARQGYDLVIGNGFLMGDSLAAVAKRFPNTNFAIIDFPWVALKGKPKNARGLIFRENEAGYLAGVAASTVSKSKTVSSVGGQAVPAVVAFLAGYKAGAKGAKVLSAYSEDFVDQAKCKEIALNQISQGSDVVFAAAGGCGLGALQAAKEQGKWGIGVDNDQGFLGPHILTSATKKVDLAVFTTIQQQQDNAFKGGTDGIFTVKNGGVGFGKVSVKAPGRAKLIAKLTATSKAIAAGKIKIPSK